MNMREKMARALCLKQGINPDARGYGLGKTMPEGASYPLWESQLGAVDSALDELLTPTDGMCSSLRSGTANSDINPFWVWQRNAEYFACMVQAAKDGA